VCKQKTIERSIGVIFVCEKENKFYDRLFFIYSNQIVIIMKIAIEGCAHGELEKIYETLQLLEQKENVKVIKISCCKTATYMQL
jgi:hypothetical protein